MPEPGRVAIAKVPTGVPGLDEVLGGGLVEYSFNLIAGTPGAGKTTLAHQIMFNMASVARPALYFTVLGEPPLKMLRYQQQMAFFDPTMVGSSIHFIDLSDVVLQSDLTKVLEHIVRHVEETGPGLVVVDSFQTVARADVAQSASGFAFRDFVQRLAIHLTSWQATTFLVGEYEGSELHGSPVFTVADGILALSQSVARNSAVRKLQVLKSRGQAPMAGLHTFRIDEVGVQVFPRMSMPAQRNIRTQPVHRTNSGVPGLDELVGGGIPAGDAVLVAGPSGTGKSVLTAQFIGTGARQGEPGVIAVFEEHPDEYLRRAASLGIDLRSMVQDGTVEVIYLRPLDLSPDEILQAIRLAVARIGAKRVVIDSVSGFELALAPTFQEDFRESLYRLASALTGTGITLLMTMEIVQNFGELRFSPYVISFLADDILLLRYVEVAGELEKNLTVVKMRNSDHSKDLMRYDITGQGVVIRSSFRDYRGVGTGAAELRDGVRQPGEPGLTDSETAAFHALIDLGESPLAAVARRIGLGEAETSAAVARLVSLRYAARRQQQTETVFRPLARSS
jgi:circadian clock protein KaiC